MILQNSLNNISFLTLLGSMILYWVETSFAGINLAGQKKEKKTVLKEEVSFGEMSTVVAIASKESLLLNEKDKEGQSFAKIGILISNCLLGLLLLVRWKESGHFPLSNLYESLMFLSWCFTSLHLYIDSYTSEKNEKNVLARKLLGAITTPSALLTNAFAAFTLPKEMQEAGPLVPALQSNWLMMHVTVMILSYAALILGSLLSIAFLVLTNSSSTEKENKKEVKNENFALILDNLSYRILGIGFPLLTIGILSGAVWANEAWGSYWSWDPKETWALLTWLIFAIYLHTRLSKGWEGKKPAIIASFGFLIVWICYLGVNLLGEGLHSYGWIVKS